MKNKTMYIFICFIILSISILFIFFIKDDTNNTNNIDIKLINNNDLIINNSSNEFSYNFSIECTNTTNSSLGYDIVLEKNSDNLYDYIMVSLIDTDNGNILVKPTYLKDLKTTTIYSSKVNGGELTYQKNLKLKFIIKENTLDTNLSNSFNLKLIEK